MAMFTRDLERIKGPEAKGAFLHHLYDGLNLAEACAALRINPGALAMARKNDLDFDNDIRAAQAFRVDMLVDKLENIQDHEPDAMMAGVISKNIQWIASKRYRQIYGDKVDVNHNVTINIVDAMNEARVRTLGFIDAIPLEYIDNSTDNVSVAQEKAPALISQSDDIDPLS